MVQPDIRAAHPRCLAVLTVLGCAVFSVSWGRDPRPRVFFYVGPVRFSSAPSGQTLPGVVPLTNMMGEKVMVKSVVMEGGSKALAMPEALSAPFVMAPAERYDIPVTIYAKKGSGSARLRIVASTLKIEIDVVEIVKFHYQIQ
jgi:hypothetical protein